jgi:hypothetical protein
MHGEIQLGHDRLEIMAIGAQPMEPDDSAIYLRFAADFNGVRYIQDSFPQPVKQRILTAEMA